MKRWYLDNCATTPIAPHVAAAMADFLSSAYGNPSSIHHEGRMAARVLADARSTLAGSMGAKPAEVVFTSSGTEANNLAISGIISRAIRETGKARVVTSTTEHASVRTRLALEQRIHGDALEVTHVNVDEQGLLKFDELDAALVPETSLVTFLFVNNETGVVQSVDQLKQRKLKFPHVTWLLDVVQAQSKILLDVRLWPFDMLSFSAHKIYGPKGIGALFIRGGVELEPMIVGGAQEKYRRAGTENMPGVVGFAAAVDIAPPLSDVNTHIDGLEKAFLSELDGQGIAYHINGPAEPGDHRLPGFLNMSFDGVSSREDLQIALDLEGVSLSSTSACHSGVAEESHVLAAMGIEGERRSGAIRLLLSRYDTAADATACADVLSRVVKRMTKEIDAVTRMS